MTRREFLSIPVLNGLRITLAALALITMVLLIARARRALVANADHFTVRATGSLVTFMLLTVVSQLTQIGHPLRTWYGLPLLAIGTVLSLAALRKSKI